MDNNKVNKLDMKSTDIVSNNIEKIEKLFPNVVKEGKVDFETLKQELSNDIIDDKKERYQLTWPGKKEALVEANTPTNKTLIPLKQKSVNFKNTNNIYIEGDNLDSLKILQNSYLNKIKCIFIDPPYNTGNDFIYNDVFYNKEEEIQSGIVDEYNKRLITNSDSNGKFHSDWLSMIYPRLKLARNLLTNDGVIFISIDENEVHNLRKICDEIFGEKNFVSNFIWQSRTSISNDYEISLNHNHILVYSKNRTDLLFGGDPIDETEYINPDNDPRGPWKLVPIDANHAGGDTVYPIKNPATNIEYYPPNGRIWCYNRETMKKLLDDNRIKFGLNDDSAPKRKLFLNERIEKGDKKTPSSIILDAGTTKDGTIEIMDLFNGVKVFDYPKPVTLMKKLINYGAPNGGIILDFFSGSATTAQAVLELNSKNNYKFIMIQLPENLDETINNCSSSAKKTIQNAIDYLEKKNLNHYLTDLAEERLKNVLIRKKLSAGFRVYKVESSNMKDVYYEPSKLNQLQLNMFESNIKEDRTAEDLLTQVILDLGLTLDLSIEEKEILNNKVYFVADNALVACFDDKINIDIINQICEIKPLKVVFRESSFRNDSDKINAFERIKKLSPETEISVI